MYKLTILLLTILEGQITYMTFYLESLKFSDFLILHILVILVLFFSNQYNKMDAFIYNRMAFAIPFVGIFLYLIDLIFLRKNDFNIVEEVFDFDKYLDEKKFLKEVDLGEELKLISAIDTMSVEGIAEKKDFIIKFKPEDIKIRVKMLRKGLVDKDVEVVHYSAVEFNQLSVKFEKQLRKYKRIYKEHNGEKEFQDLIIFYEKYLKSDILEGEILKLHRKLYIEILERRVKVDKKIVNYIKLLDMYLLLKKYEVVEKKCLEFLEKKVQHSGVYELLIKVYYETDNLEGLKNIRETYKKEKVIISKKVENIFKICGIEG